ncbi:MAG: twitching motility protein [candidate division CPR2 bacterium GW2011_GWC1_39_9]|uniref:Twitching motility protein n=1 Tax=candidate division CPR2 bacterium GW2011_GWC2_39_10 TaxID=1618345 RepID=A0A0G0LVW5_UNCC2|nr:MAG: twitching motility protein [candidate division CPR2 bacterium GW2011_GWC2_39_10]KKR35662.1 MAG: twitching motility protein [candidate division CPR2 bacterium GW2011_GWC1_39_9]
MPTQTIKVEHLLEEVLKQDASDLHLSVGVPPVLRVDGRLVPLSEYGQLTAEQTEDIVFQVVDDNQKEIFIRDKEVDFSFAFGDVARFRANAYHQRGNAGLALRLIPTKIRSIEDLGLPKVCFELAKIPRGLVLFTGPTGSGKSTSLAAMINYINTEKACHIITVEDPIEYNHVNKKSILEQREVHYDTRSFAAALRSVLREDPDVVLVGEMRDLETIAAAITIAETGHLVLATLHTNSAAQSVDRIVDVFPPHQQQQVRVQLAGMLQGIISQRLVPAIGGGRVAIAEVMIATAAVRNIIREGKTHQLEGVIQTGTEHGMITMDSALANFVKAGKITLDEAKSYSIDIQQLERYIRG